MHATACRITPTIAEVMITSKEVELWSSGAPEYVVAKGTYVTASQRSDVLYLDLDVLCKAMGTCAAVAFWTAVLFGFEHSGSSSLEARYASALSARRCLAYARQPW
jgi:glutamate dehydrogenase/leucine dehydrogenase